MPRYIDTEYKYFPTKYTYNKTQYAAGWNACLNSIAQQPTADAQEVKHAHWVSEGYENEYMTCSNCKKSYKLTYTLDAMEKPLFNYCPNCGERCSE